MTIPRSVALQIRDDTIEDYVRAAAFLNAGRFDVVCLQHEFGIFGGEAGAHILELLSRLSMPVVTTLHTVLAKPSAAQRAVMERIVEASSKVVVMANKGREMLRSVYRRAGRQDRGHRPRHSRLSVCRAGRGKGQTRIQRPLRHSDLRPAFPQQGHRGHDRRHALDPETSRRTRSTSCSARRIQIWFATRARPIARA